MSHADFLRAGNLLGAAGLAVADRLTEAAGGSEAAALVGLSGPAAGASIDSLARIIGLSHSGAVRLVDRLAGSGLVERRPGADQRSVALVLTPAGRRAARQVLARREAAMQALLAPLTAAERGALSRALERMLGPLAPPQRVCRLCDAEACGRSRGRCPVTV